MQSESKNCAHEDFKANVNINRLEDTGRFSADVRIECVQCGVPMRFLGLPAGVDLEGASTSVDATEARLAIAPKGEVVSALEGAPLGFSVRGTGHGLLYEAAKKLLDTFDRYAGYGWTFTQPDFDELRHALRNMP